MLYDMLIFSALLLAYLRLQENPTLRRTLVLGLLEGVALLENPAIAGFIFLAHAWLFFVGLRRQPFATHVRIHIVSLLLAASLLAPWAVRNGRVFHQFVPFTDNLPLELWFGNNPLATGGFYRGPQPQLEGIDLAQLNEVQRNQALGQAAISYIVQHPGRAIELRLYSLYYFLFGAWQFSRFPSAANQLWFWGNAFLICMSASGLILLIFKEGRKGLLLLLLVIGLSLPYLITHSGDDRYRAGLGPLWMVSLAYLVFNLLISLPKKLANS